MVYFHSNNVMRNLRMRLVHRPAITTDWLKRTGNIRLNPASVRARSRAAEACLSGSSKRTRICTRPNTADSPQKGKQR